MAVNLRKPTGTGHTIGVTYASHFGGGLYRVLDHGRFYPRAARTIDRFGKIRDRLTPLSVSQDHPASEECPLGLCPRRIERTGF